MEIDFKAFKEALILTRELIRPEDASALALQVFIERYEGAKETHRPDEKMLAIKIRDYHADKRGHEIAKSCAIRKEFSEDALEFLRPYLMKREVSNHE